MTRPRAVRTPGVPSIWAACAALLIGGAGYGCQRSGDWNEVFHRNEGWWYSDGAVSAELPGGKTVWLFGDTRLRDNAGFLSNSMAVQDTRPGRAPLPSEIRFFARAGSGELLDVSKLGMHAARAWVEPRANRDDSLSTWLWPTAARMSGGRMIATYAELGCPVAEFAECRGAMGRMAVTGHSVVEVENPLEPPENWRTRATSLLDRRGQAPSANRLHWGSALLEDRGWLYVFGVTFGNGWKPEDVKLARSVPSDVGRYDRWQFLTPQGWQMLPTGPTPVELQTVAHGGATEMSVERVVRHGKAWLVMLHLDFVAQEVVVRSAPAGEIESMRWDGPEAGRRVRRLSLPGIDPDTAGGLSWSVRAHVHHSSPDRSLLMSFYSGRTAGLRFVELATSSLLD